MYTLGSTRCKNWIEENRRHVDIRTMFSFTFYVTIFSAIRKGVKSDIIFLIIVNPFVEVNMLFFVCFKICRNGHYLVGLLGSCWVCDFLFFRVVWVRFKDVRSFWGTSWLRRVSVILLTKSAILLWSNFTLHFMRVIKKGKCNIVLKM